MKYLLPTEETLVLVEQASQIVIDCLRKGNEVLTFGVGGNAANAMHFAAELSGKFEGYTKPLPCICLSENPCILTAITNDFGWGVVFSRQIEALAKPGDVVVVFSISTTGGYLLPAVDSALRKNCHVILICGRDQLKLAPDVNFTVIELSSNDTPTVQEEQLKILHQICKLVKEEIR